MNLCLNERSLFNFFADDIVVKAEEEEELVFRLIALLQRHHKVKMDIGPDKTFLSTFNI